MPANSKDLSPERLDALGRIAKQLEVAFNRVAIDGSRSKPVLRATEHKKFQQQDARYRRRRLVISRNVTAKIDKGILVSPSGSDVSRFKEITWDRDTHQVISYDLDLR